MIRISNRPHKYGLLVISFVLAIGFTQCGTRRATSPENIAIQTCFSPKGKCAQFVIDAVNKAQKSILVQAYYFTSIAIAEALVQAHKDGVNVRMLIDKSQLEYPRTRVYHMAKAGIPVAVDKVAGSAHSKVMIIDNDYVLTGSFNWTQAAEYRNVENLILIKDRTTNKIYRKAWHLRAKKAVPLPKKKLKQ